MDLKTNLNQLDLFQLQNDLFKKQKNATFFNPNKSRTCKSQGGEHKRFQDEDSILNISTLNKMPESK